MIIQLWLSMESGIGNSCTFYKGSFTSCYTNTFERCSLMLHPTWMWVRHMNNLKLHRSIVGTVTPQFRLSWAEITASMLLIVKLALAAWHILVFQLFYCVSVNTKFLSLVMWYFINKLKYWSLISVILITSLVLIDTMAFYIYIRWVECWPVQTHINMICTCTFQRINGVNCYSTTLSL